VLAPIFFLALNYVVFGRLLRCAIVLDSLAQGKKLSFMSPNRVSTIFLGSDIISFLIQAAGAGLASGTNLKTVRVGLNILLAGMALNLASFTLFISLVVYFDLATRRAYGDIKRTFAPVIRTLYVSWTLIMIRMVFRLVEFSMGWSGPVNTDETYFYCFDSVMM
jgi:RTA1 like protein